MKKILLSAVCVLAFAATADARPIGTGQEMWRGNAPWAMTGPQGSDGRGMRDGMRDDRFERRDGGRMDNHMDRDMHHGKKCAKGKKGMKCRKMMMKDRDMNRDGDMRREDMMHRDRMGRDDHSIDRDNSWHAYDRNGERHMDLDNDGRRW